MLEIFNAEKFLKIFWPQAMMLDPAHIGVNKNERIQELRGLQ